LFVKVTDKKWAKPLLDGNIFMRALASFADLSKSADLFKRKLDTSNTYRGDVLEGISESFVGGYTPYGYATWRGKVVKDGTVGVIDTLTFRKKVFCLYSLEYDPVKKCFVKPDEQLRSFGDTAIVITDATEFLRRINTALIEKYESSFQCSCKRVQYNVDLNDSFNYNEFCKSRSYSWQNEFRVSLDLSEGRFHPEVLEKVTDYAKANFLGRIEEDSKIDSISDTLLLSIGCIRDICIEMPVSELLELENNVFVSILPQRILGYENEREARPTFIKRVFRLSDGTLAFSVNWLDSAVM